MIYVIENWHCSLKWNVLTLFLMLFNFKKICLLFMYTFICLHKCCVTCVCVVLMEIDREKQIPKTGVLDVCESKYGSWESSLDPLQEHQVLLTTELSH